MKKTMINLFVFLYFYVIYISLIYCFYFTHFNLIHNTYPIGDEMLSNFTEWCPFGEHTRVMNNYTGGLFVILPILLSIVNVIIFNNVKKKIKIILFTIPVIFIFILYFLMYLNPLE